MQKLIKCLKLFDTFDVALNLKVDSNTQYYKTVYGALITLLIYALSLMYAIYILIQWKTYQISPKMSQTPYISSLSVDLEYDVIDISYWIYKEGLIDPLQQQNNILIPLLQLVDSQGNATYISLLNQTVIGKKQSTITLNQGINIYDQNGNINDQITRTVLIVSCQDQFLNSGEFCASDQEIREFFKQPQNLLIVTINSRLLDLQNTPQNASYTTYFYLEPSLMYTFNADLKTSTYHIKNQLFTDAGSTEEYLSGQNAYGQSNTIEFSKQAFSGLSAYGSLYITLQPLQTLVVLEYPHIGELLAQIGSVVSLLFIFKYFIAYMNYDYMWQHVVDQIISYYYPQFTEIKIEYNCFRKIKSAKFRNQQFDIEKFRIFHKQLSDRIQTKMTFNNIIYELSRLYMIIRSMQSQVEIRKLHNVGIDFDILRLQRRNSVIESNHNQNPNALLNDDDVDLISLSQRFKYKDLIEDEVSSRDTIHIPSRLNPFYELNILHLEL